MADRLKKIALLGNPNCGKTSLFNQLTGLNQKVGNFTGVTTARYSGFFRAPGQRYELVDLPGSYSLYARSEDERVVLRTLFGGEDFAALIFIVDANNLRRGMLLLTQLRDLGLPMVVALNMVDEAFRAGLRIDISALSAQLQLPVVATNARRGEGLPELRRALGQLQSREDSLFLPAGALPQAETVAEVQQALALPNAYWAHLYLQQGDKLELPTDVAAILHRIAARRGYPHLEAQREELQRRQHRLMAELYEQLPAASQAHLRLSDKIDKVLTHGFYGTVVFLLLLLLIFQVIFAWSEPLMDIIDAGFVALRGTLSSALPASLWGNLLNDGFLTGIGGVVVFVPQIAFLFLLIGMLEESGYMARVVTLSDRIMRYFGLHGRSIIPLISGMACAIPAVMATRGIGERKERLLTILVVPLMSCSARLPVYTMLIALIFSRESRWGAFNLQGLLLLALYLLGTAAALGMAALLQRLLPRQQPTFLVMELPPYRWPQLRNVLLSVYEKVRSFVLEAGKVILALSIVLWVLATYGGSAAYQEELRQLRAPSPQVQASLRLKHSYMGQIGRQIEPLIAPLGYDWKIGIALVSSFAAREVFVSTLAIVYSLGDSDSTVGLQQRLRSERREHSNEPVFSFAVCASLLIFYAFAMQCMSTLAIVYRETRSWRWPLLQLLYMTVLAYVSAWLIYTVLS